MVGAIIQARMGSSRLPGKVLKTLAGKPVLWHVVNRLQYCDELDKIIVATSKKEIDNEIAEFCSENNLRFFRGSEEDVLSRYYHAAVKFNLKHVVRVTADCPVIDPNIVDEVIRGYFEGGYDLYGIGGEFPQGLDCCIFSFSTLKKGFEKAVLPSEREHVTPYIKKNTEKFKVGFYEKFENLGYHRWTLDYECDYILLKRIYDALYESDKIFLTENILTLLNERPELIKINNDISRNEGYRKSLEQDKAFRQEIKD